MSSEEIATKILELLDKSDDGAKALEHVQSCSADDTKRRLDIFLTQDTVLFLRQWLEANNLSCSATLNPAFQAMSRELAGDRVQV